MKATLVRGCLQHENAEAKEALENSHISYSQMFSSTNYSPMLLVEDDTFPYKGVASIKGYCDSFKKNHFKISV